MAYVKNVWTDQDVERPRTYQMNENQDGSVTLIDDFGLVTDLGTPVNADNMNHIEDGIANCVDKSGDTMSGNLSIIKEDSNLFIENTRSEQVGTEYFGVEIKDDNFDIATTSAPATANNSCRLVFRDKNNRAVAWLQNRHFTDGNMFLNLGTRRIVNGQELVNGLNIGFSSAGETIFSFPDTRRIDGQPNDSYESIMGDTSLKHSSNADLNKTVTLPNDGNIYAVTLRTILTSGTTAGNYVRLVLNTNVLSQKHYVEAALTWTSHADVRIATVTIPMKYGTNNLTIARNSNYNGTASLEKIGQRRIGLNA